MPFVGVRAMIASLMKPSEPEGSLKQHFRTYESFILFEILGARIRGGGLATEIEGCPPSREGGLAKVGL